MKNPFRESARRLSPPQVSATAYHGATHSRLTDDWLLASIQSADSEIRGDLKALRKRARELVRNTSFGARFLAHLRTNVIGPKGITLQAQPEGLDGEVDNDAARSIERAWREWGAPETCSADGRLSWVEVQDLQIQTEAQDGESLIRILPGFRNRFGFSLQMLDPDQLDETFNRPSGKGRNEIRMGVEIDRWGRPVAYHLWDAHPTDFQASSRRKRMRVPADQIIHRYVMKRPGQTRGVPWFAPILMDGRMLAALQEAELVASRMSAMKGAVYQQSPDAVLDPNSPAGQVSAPEFDLEPGVNEVLPPGWEYKAIDPQHPNSAFAEFNRIILHSIAAGLGISYSGLTGDLTQVSFSSIRQGALHERDVWRDLQARTATHVHRRVFESWLRWALVSGVLDVDARRLEEIRPHMWRPRGWSWIDPLKDMKAFREAEELHIDSKTRMASELGRDFEEIIEDQRREKAKLTNAGLAGRSADTTTKARSGGGVNRVPASLNGNGRSHVSHQ